MGTIALWCWHLSFSLLAAAMALAWGQGRSNVARRAALALALVPLLALHATLAWITLGLRFRLDVGSAPWVAATGMLAAHGLGALLLFARSRREPGAAAWPVGILAVCTLAAVALDVTTLWNLELKARVELAQLGLEAGRIAWRESPPRPEPEDNAAPIYLDAAAELRRGDDGLLDPWLPALRDKAPWNASDPALRAALESVAPSLESVRKATRLPACWFEPEPSSDPSSPNLVAPPFQPLFALADALELEGRVRAADGDWAGALADLEAMLGLARHVLQTPSLLTALLASSMRSRAVTSLAHTLSAPDLDPRDLQHLEVSIEPALVGVAPRALAREEAFCLSAVAQLSRPATNAFFSDGARGLLQNRLASALYKAFMVESEVEELRRDLQAIQTLAQASVPELRALQAAKDQVITRRGSLAAYLIPNMLPVLLALHRSDSEMELAGLAVEAARWRLAHGRYPRTLAEIGREGSQAFLEGDGTYVRLTRPDAGDAELRLPTTAR
jgi:hypothetical protein